MGAPSRRSLVLGGGALVAATAAGVVGVAALPPQARAPRRPLQALSPRAFSVLAAVADGICPGGPDLPSAWELEVPEAIDELMSRKHPADVAELSQGLLLLDNAAVGLVLDGRMGRFTALSPEGRHLALEAWRSSQLPDRRKAFRALSGLVSSAYWGHPRTHAFVGYPGPPRFPT